MNTSVHSSTTLWSERVAKEILRSGSRGVLVCDPDSGIEWAIRRLEISELPVLRIWIEDVGSTSLQETLANSIRRSFGHELADSNAPLQSILARLAVLLDRLGPVFVVIGWFENLTSHVPDLIRAIPSNCRVLVVSQTATGLLDELDLDVIDSSFLAMRVEEARVAQSDSLDRMYIQRAYTESGGKFGLFLSALDAGPMNLEPYVAQIAADSSRRAFGQVDEPMLRALWANGRVVEAFDLACTDFPSLVPEYVEKAGNLLFDCGAFHFLWDCLSALPLATRQSPEVAYWLYAVGAAINRLSEVQDLAQDVLDKSDAPNLRAAVAVMRPGVKIDAETQRAVSCDETAVTVRARAFAMAVCGDRHSPVLLLRRAMALAERLDANHLVVACALDISNQEITLGRLRSGRDWALWALGQIEHRHLSEDYRRQTALSGAAFANLLLGNLQEAGRYISQMNPDTTRIGVPTYESVISTMGDWYLLNDDARKASYYYERNLAAGPVTQYASASLDVVKASLAESDFDRALQQAESAYSLSRTSTPLERALGSLAMGMALSSVDGRRALTHLSEAQISLAQTSFAIFEAQALLWVARIQYERNNLEATRHALEMASKFTAELGSLGWQFLLANYERADDLRGLQDGGVPIVSLNFLGGSNVQIDGEIVTPSLRHCEILTVLADRQGGIPSEALQLLVFGDDGTLATTKSTVSRLRKTVPVSAAPYRIQATVVADFLQLLDFLDKGKVHQALRLYNGALLPESDAPGVIELRNYITESLRYAVLASRDADLLIQLGTVLEDDLEVWEVARSSLAIDDRRKPLVTARIRRVKASW